MKRFSILVSVLLSSVLLFGQAPQMFSYQAVIRNSDGTLATNQTIGMQIGIFQGSINGTEVYRELIIDGTNSNGLISLEIGGGNGFSDIDWSDGPYFIKTQTDLNGGSDYTVVSTSQILTVPYALHANSADTLTGGITESDPVYVASAAQQITSNDISNWNNKLDAEVDGDIGNELQNLSLSGTALSISQGNTVNLPTSSWITSGSNVYHTGGLVGIGITNPQAMLEVYDAVGYHFLKFVSEDNVYTTWQSDRFNVDDYQIGIDGGNNKFIFANTTKNLFPLVIHGPNIGFGTLNPEAPVHIKDFMKLEPRSSAPGTPSAGMVYFDSNDNKLKVYTGSAWEILND